jgi:hypothetical protein
VLLLFLFRVSGLGFREREEIKGEQRERAQCKGIGFR